MAGMAASAILALDQGTTATAAIVFDAAGRPAAGADREIRQIYPRPGWVEHDAEEIFATTIAVAREALGQAGVSRPLAIGLTNQRETLVVWDRRSGRPVANAIVWQDRRTANRCAALRAAGWEREVRSRTGLVIDPYFTATKLEWIFRADPRLAARAARGEVLAGTIDAWLIWRLTGGRVHRTDYSNASRTMLFNLRTLAWDAGLCRELGIPPACLPDPAPSSGDFGETLSEFFGEPIPIRGVAGDQQAALFGQTCFEPGDAKCTYGTGSFLLAHTGSDPVPSDKLITTVAWGLGDRVEYALEGSIFITGAAVQWLRDGLGVIDSAAAIEDLARQVPDSGDVFFVPAFAGLGAPEWDPAARGTIVGITGGTTRAHLARATLDAIAFQVRDVADAFAAEADRPIGRLRVDGGGAANDLLLQTQADLLGCPVERPAVTETTAAGAAYLAGLAIGLWPDRAALRALRVVDRVFDPGPDAPRLATAHRRWRRAVDRSRAWADPAPGEEP